MSGGLSAEDVRRVARLARLAVDESRIEGYRAELSAVLGYVERIRSLNLEGVEPLAHVGAGENRLDVDSPRETLAGEALMRMAPGTMPPYIKVPKVLGEGGGA